MDSNNEYCNRWFWQDYSITVPNTEYLSHATITADLRINFKYENKTINLQNTTKKEEGHEA